MKLRQYIPPIIAEPSRTHAIYNPLDWYWRVGDAPPTRVWSSASLTFVETTDPTYLAWLARGGVATVIPSKADLLLVMQQQIQPTIMQRGAFLVSKKTKALNGRFAFEDNMRNFLHATRMAIMAGRPLPGGGNNFNHLDADGNHHIFTAEQFLEFAEACEHYIYNWTQALVSNINGSPIAYPPNKMPVT